MIVASAHRPSPVAIKFKLLGIVMPAAARAKHMIARIIKAIRTLMPFSSPQEGGAALERAAPVAPPRQSGTEGSGYAAVEARPNYSLAAMPSYFLPYDGPISTT